MWGVPLWTECARSLPQQERKDHSTEVTTAATGGERLGGAGLHAQSFTGTIHFFCEDESPAHSFSLLVAALGLLVLH